MEKTSRIVTTLSSKGGELVNLKIRATKLQVYTQVTNLLVGSINAAIVAALLIFVLLFVSIRLAFVIGEALRSLQMGFFIMGGFYLLVLTGFALALKTRRSDPLKNVILSRVSEGAITDFDELLETNAALQRHIAETETVLKANFEELKEGLNKLVDDFNKLRDKIIKDANGEPGQLPKAIVNTAIDFALNTFALQNAGAIKRAVFPMVAKALVSTALRDKENPGFFGRMRLKLSKLLS